jgi:hypothetical protein
LSRIFDDLLVEVGKSDKSSLSVKEGSYSWKTLATAQLKYILSSKGVWMLADEVN